MPSPPQAVSPQPSAKAPFVMHGKNKRAHIDDSGSTSGSRPKNRRRTLTTDAGEIPAKYLELISRTGKPGEPGARPESSPRQGPPTLMASANVRNNSTNQHRAKWNSTSPGEGFSPKRSRPSLSGGDHPNPPGPSQNQPPMASVVPFNPQQGGPLGPQNMQSGMVLPPMNHQTTSNTKLAVDMGYFASGEYLTNSKTRGTAY